jgi:hypothetical protein
MKTNLLIPALVLSFLSPAAFANDGVVGQDQTRIEQDKANLKKDKEELKKVNEKIKEDKSAGNKVELKKDRMARRELRRNKKEDKMKLKQDAAEKQHDQKNG